jgi:hypothetical protein
MNNVYARRRASDRYYVIEVETRQRAIRSNFEESYE